jgi:hypothetical protein
MTVPYLNRLGFTARAVTSDADLLIFLFVEPASERLLVFFERCLGSQSSKLRFQLHFWRLCLFRIAGTAPGRSHGA